MSESHTQTSDSSPPPALVEDFSKLPPRTDTFASTLLTSDQLYAMNIPPRPRVLGQWMRQGDMGYLFAPRGAGKSWMAMLIGKSISEGAPLGEWSAGESARPVVYFDAEMNLSDVHQRVQMLGISSPLFSWLSNDHFYMQRGYSVDIANAEHQQQILDMMPPGSVLIIDNLSTGQSGMKENDNDDFDKLKEWLLSLRRRDVTVLIVHHAGRNGLMRGSSRREDMAHWIIKLDDDPETESKAKRFTTEFLKCRNCQATEAPPLRWTMRTEGVAEIECAKHSERDALLAHIRDGIVSASELAEQMGVKASTISKWVKPLLDTGVLVKKNRDYAIAEPATTYTVKRQRVKDSPKLAA